MKNKVKLRMCGLLFEYDVRLLVKLYFAKSYMNIRTIINKSHNLAERISFCKIMAYFLNYFILRHLTNSNKLVIEKFIQNMYNRIKLL